MDAHSVGMGRAGLSAVMVLYFFSLGFSIVTPGMAKFAEAFPDHEYALINSLPTLFISLAGLVFGSVAGRRVGYRTLAILGSAVCLVAGLAPAFIDDFYLILVCRAFTGLGLGFLIPMANALVNGCFEGDRRARLLSVGSLMLNVGGIVLQSVGGFLADIGWQTTFYGYLLFIVALAFSFLIPDVPGPEGGSGIRGLDRRMAVVVILFMVYGMLQFSVMQNTSELFESRGAGGSSAAGLALSVFTLAGCVGGIAYSRVKSRSTRAVFPLIWAFTAVGAAMQAVLTDTVGMTAGLAVFGLGFGMIIPAFVEWAGAISRPSVMAFATALVTSGLYLGDFLSMGWRVVGDALSGEHILFNLWATAAVGIVLVLAFAVYDPLRRRTDGRCRRGCGALGGGPERDVRGSLRPDRVAVEHNGRGPSQLRDELLRAVRTQLVLPAARAAVPDVPDHTVRIPVHDTGQDYVREGRAVRPGGDEGGRSGPRQVLVQGPRQDQGDRGSEVPDAGSGELLIL